MRGLNLYHIYKEAGWLELTAIEPRTKIESKLKKAAIAISEECSRRSDNESTEKIDDWADKAAQRAFKRILKKVILGKKAYRVR